MEPSAPVLEAGMAPVPPFASYVTVCVTVDGGVGVGVPPSRNEVRDESSPCAFWMAVRSVRS